MFIINIFSFSGYSIKWTQEQKTYCNVNVVKE